MSAFEKHPGPAADIPAPRDPRISRALARATEAPLREHNSITVLRDGPETYDDWLAEIGRAKRWVHLENYIFTHGAVGRRFAEALAEQAAAGVTVRVLYDWFGCSNVPGSFWRALRQSGVDVRAVNPPHLSDPLEFVKRDHRKLVAVDGVYASVGGVCIDDPWMERSPVTGLPYRDTSVAIRGPAVADVERAFAAVWARSGPPLPADEQVSFTSIAPAGDVEARVIVQEPGRMRMMRVLQLLLAGAERRVWIADAYFLASRLLREALIAAAHDGVDVRILLPATNDLPAVAVLSRYGYRPLLEAGVRIWEYTGLMMHAKTTVADGWWARIGSTNMNVTGLLTNWEIDLVAENRALGAAMERMYEEDLAHAREIRLGGSLRHRPRPVRPESQAERAARRGHGTKARVRAGVAAARVGAALQTAGNETLRRHERLVTGAVGGTLLGVSLLGARFPRLIAWPLAAVGGAVGGLGLARAFRSPRPHHQASPRRRTEWFRAQLRRMRGSGSGRRRLARS